MKTSVVCQYLSRVFSLQVVFTSLVIFMTASGCQGESCRVLPRFHEQVYDIPALKAPDILFILDNSPSMQGKLPIVKAEIRRWVAKNLQISFGGLGYRLGLLTTSVVSDGCPVCNGGTASTCIQAHSDDGRLRPWGNRRFFDEGEEESFLAALDTVEPDGCPYESAMRLRHTLMEETVVEWRRCCRHGGRVLLGAGSPFLSLTGGLTSTLDCRHEPGPAGTGSGARFVEFDDGGLAPAAATGGDR